MSSVVSRSGWPKISSIHKHPHRWEISQYPGRRGAGCRKTHTLPLQHRAPRKLTQRLGDLIIGAPVLARTSQLDLAQPTPATPCDNRVICITNRYLRSGPAASRLPDRFSFGALGHVRLRASRLMSAQLPTAVKKRTCAEVSEGPIGDITVYLFKCEKLVQTTS